MGLYLMEKVFWYVAYLLKFAFTNFLQILPDYRNSGLRVYIKCSIHFDMFYFCCLKVCACWAAENCLLYYSGITGSMFGDISKVNRIYLLIDSSNGIVIFREHLGLQVNM
jgi:hypothetical protein